MMFCQDIGKHRSQGDFNPFNGIEQQQAKAAVEDIDGKNILEGCPSSKMMVRITLLQWQGVGTEPVVTDDGKIVAGTLQVGYDKTTAFPKRKLLCKRCGRFGEERHTRNPDKRDTSLNKKSSQKVGKYFL
jgi:hypothetical protein